MPYNNFGIEVDCLRSEARYVKYGIPEMNALEEKMEIKDQLAAAIRVSTGFKKYSMQGEFGEFCTFLGPRKIM